MYLLSPCRPVNTQESGEESRVFWKNLAVSSDTLSMSFRRIPFQFSTIDPAERQRELEKRFGLPVCNKMTVDNPNPFSMGPGLRETRSSPRLQHRVPIFVEGYDNPVKTSVDSAHSGSENKKPNVRVIPIEVEGAGTQPSERHRTFSGPAKLPIEESEDLPWQDDTSSLKRSMQDIIKPPKIKATAGPKVYNIPVQVEGAVPGKTVKSKNSKAQAKKDVSKVNKCDVSKLVKSEEKCESELTDEQKTEMSIYSSIKKIDNVLDELKSYECGVEEFNGTAKDKQYRYLDEMLTRCMLRLDDIDTMGNEKLRFTRKDAIKKVQACIDLLETKINISKDASDSSITEITPVEVAEVNDVEMTESQNAEIILPDKRLNVNEVDLVESCQRTVTKEKCLNAKACNKSCEITELDTDRSPQETNIENHVEQSQDIDLGTVESEDIKSEGPCHDMKNQINQVHMTEISNTINSASGNQECLKENLLTVLDNNCKDEHVTDAEMTEIKSESKEKSDSSDCNQLQDTSQNQTKGAEPNELSCRKSEYPVNAQSIGQDCFNCSNQKDAETNDSIS